jgi:deoxycytidylate deaminase
MIEKRCIASGCNDYPAFGWGLPSSKQPMQWACAAHRNRIGPQQQPPLSGVGRSGGGGLKGASPPKPVEQQKQGVLL